MAEKLKKERSPDVTKPEKRQAMEGDVTVPSPLPRSRSVPSFSSGSEVEEQDEEIAKSPRSKGYFVLVHSSSSWLRGQSEGMVQSPESEEMVHSSKRFSYSPLVSQSSSSSQDLTTSFSLSSIEDQNREKITITEIENRGEYVEYLYSIEAATKEKTEGETDTEMEWADEEGNEAEKPKGEPIEGQTFRYPIFNDQSFSIYNKFIIKNWIYYIEMHERMRIKQELYHIQTSHCISLEMFKEIAKTLTTPPKVMEVNEESIVMVCGAIKNSYEAFLNFDTKTPTLIRYLIRLAVQVNPDLQHLKPEDIVPSDTMYAMVDRKNNQYSRLKFPEGYEHNTDHYRKLGERNRNEQQVQEQDGKYTHDDLENRQNRRKKAAERDSETFIFLSVDTGMGCPRHISKIFLLSDVCAELLDIPPQATKVFVTSLDDDTKYPPYALEDYYPGPQLLRAKRVQEPDGEIPHVELVSLPMKCII